jgi:AraC-like DNA-binding protein
VTLPIAWYRELAPCSALHAHVAALFSFVPGAVAAAANRCVLREVGFADASFCSPQFADGHVSIVLELGRRCDGEGRWSPDSIGLRGSAIGPMSTVGRIEGRDRPEMVGVYFRPARVAPFLDLAVSELTDQAAAIEDVWGPAGSHLPGRLSELDETGRLDCLEAMLLARLRTVRRRAEALDVAGLAAWVLRQKGRVAVQTMARAAGVSRQHLSREFRDRIGIGPKLYSRLARFQSGLVYAGRGRIDWASVAAEMGYADQSHMIAEFRQFSGLTPEALATRQWFHPFIERARSALVPRDGCPPHPLGVRQ